MTQNDSAILAWTDIETTGLDVDDHLLELAVVVTDSQLNELTAFETLIRPQPSTFARLMANDFVATMHQTNGLIAALDSVDHELLPDVAGAEQMLIDALASVAAPGQLILMAGGGVSHFDRSFLGAWMPRLDSVLHYGSVDISDVVRGYTTATDNGRTFAKKPTKAHRAMDDVREELRIAPAIWDMYQQYNANAAVTPVEQVLAAASVVQATSSHAPQELALMIDELAPRDAIAGLASVASHLAEEVAHARGTSVESVLDSIRKLALG